MKNNSNPFNMLQKSGFFYWVQKYNIKFMWEKQVIISQTGSVYIIQLEALTNPANIGI